MWFPVARTALPGGGPLSSNPRSEPADQRRSGPDGQRPRPAPSVRPGAAPWKPGHRGVRPVRFLTESGLAAGLVSLLVMGTLLVNDPRNDEFRPLDAGGWLLMALAACSTVLPRRRAPVWALGGTMLAVGTYMLIGYPYGPVQLCMVLSMFEVARVHVPRWSIRFCGLAALLASAIALPRLTQEVRSPLLLALAWTAWIVLPWSLGTLVHLLSAARDRSRRELVARAALEERMRIAGEVHDVAGHGFAVVAMQAGVATLLFDEQPDQAREALEAIRATTAASLTELRGMLNTMHPGDSGPDGVDQPAPPVPAPEPTAIGLSKLGELVEKVRAGGLPIRLELPNPCPPVPSDIDLVAYRVVRESLTNVVRHAGPTEAAVHVGSAGEELCVEVRDRGAGGGRHREGRGLRGMRRRVEAVGGRFEAGPHPDGGFLVAARLPLVRATR